MSESLGQPNGQPGDTGSAEKIGPKCLLIDDHDGIILGANMFFNKFNFKAVECHNAETALEAIKKDPPQILFLDHSLTRGGSEGIYLVKKVLEMIEEGALPEMEIYSTTNNHGVFSEYTELGVKHIDKDDLAGLKAIMSAE